MAKLDAELELLLVQKDFFDKNPAAGKLAVGPADPIYIAIKFHGDIANLKPAGFIVGSTVANVAFGQTTLDGLEQLATHPQVETIERQRRAETHDGSVAEIKANKVWTRAGDSFSGYTGRGVIVGIIDTGIDFKHQTFRKADGKTRILKIWDQTLSVQGGETTPGPITAPSIADTPTPLGYGVEYDAAQINDTLEHDSPAVPVRHKDQNGHGTHVAGIAAGDGSQAGHCNGIYSYIGVATEADIIAVRLWGLSGDTGASPSSPNSFVVDAIRYILNEARQAARPVALNLSFGKFTEQMDGSSANATAIDTLLNNNSTGTSIVFSAGNDAAMSFHATGSVPPSPSPGLALEFTLHPKDKKARTLVVLYNGANLQARLSSPVSGNPGVVGWVASGSSANSPSANGSGAGSLVTVSNQANRIAISITPPTGGQNMAGTWKLELKSPGAAATPVDAYCLFGSTHDPQSPGFLDHVTTRSTLNEFATAKEVIAVGSYKEGGALSSFSSRGPTMDGRTKPEICAPGEAICSASIAKDRTCENCCSACCHDFYVDMSGTSMSSPHIAGVIALMLHKNPTLTHTQIRDLLRNSFAAKPTDSTPDEDLGWGAGRVDAMKTVDAAAQVNPPVPSVAAQPPPLAVLHERLLASRHGRELESAVEQHGEEVWNLIQKNRRVATIWHRCAGPTWVRLALRAMHSPRAMLPHQVDGIELPAALRRFAVALRRYGSPSLRQAVQAWEADIGRIAAGMNLEQLIDAIGNTARPTGSQALS